MELMRQEDSTRQQATQCPHATRKDGRRAIQITIRLIARKHFIAPITSCIDPRRINRATLEPPPLHYQ